MMHSNLVLRRLLPLAALLLPLAALAEVPAKAPNAGAAYSSKGADTCLSCHDEEAINGVTEGLRDRAAAHEVAIEVKIPRSLSLRVDPTALDAMLRNLVDNALKSCVAASGHRIVVDARHSAGQIELAVHDDGLGFAPEEATRIFKKFYRI